MSDLENLKAVEITLDEKDYLVRTDLQGNCYKGFRAVRIRPPPQVQSVWEAVPGVN